MADIEIWKDIYYIDSIRKELVDYRGYYQVSNLGRIKSVDRMIERAATERNKAHRVFRKGKILSPTYVKGYLHVILQKDGISKSFQVHRLVASMFIPNPENKPQVDHINTVREDCKASNLLWATRTENANNPNSVQKRIGKIPWNKGIKWHKKTHPRGWEKESDMRGFLF